MDVRTFQKKKKRRRVEERLNSVAKAILHSIVGGSKAQKSKDPKSIILSIRTNDTNSYKPFVKIDNNRE